MTILFVNNESEANKVLSQQLINDIVVYCNAPDNIAFNFVDMSEARHLGYINTYKVYNPNWAGQDIYNISYSCDDIDINNRVINETQS